MNHPTVEQSVFDPSLSVIFDLSEEKKLNKGDVITRQYASTEYFYLLIEGVVEFFIDIDETEKGLYVGHSEEPYTPIGWSGFRDPKRYATTVKAASEFVKVLRWKHDELDQLFLKQPQLGASFLKSLLPNTRNLIEESILLLNKFNPNLIEQEMTLAEGKAQELNSDVSPQMPIGLLRKSPFFEVFREETYKKLAPYIKSKRFDAGEILFKQNEKSEGLYFLATGKILFKYTSLNEQQQSVTAFRSINSPGYILSWSGAIDKPNIVTASALLESTVYYIPQKDLTLLFKQDANFYLSFCYRLLWLMGNQLRALRARLISAKFDKEIIAIQNLLEQNSTQLSVLSKLHEVPHLLDNKHTLGDGLDILNQIKKNGSTTLERSLATLSLDILGQITKEHFFYQGLLSIYNEVITSPKEAEASEVRKESANKFIRLFENVPQIVIGKELLPPEPGHIFIYNHLRNDPYNTLPNNFQLTLDSHYISSVILHNTYNDPGIRVVRISKGPEYGHQYYYSKLGHIDVFTNESEKTANTPEAKAAVRNKFYKQAEDYLVKGTNLIISPEGTSYATEESPGDFKSGAFRLALSMEKEPLIVPIVVANFDKRVRYNTLSVIIKKPFKVSEYVSDANDKGQMKHFLSELKLKYKNYVKEAMHLSAAATHNQNRFE